MKYVLFIDDDELLRDVFPRAFRTWRRSEADVAVELHVADSTASLLERLDQVTENDTVLLITDGNMRRALGFDLDGDELIEAVRTKIGDRLVRALIVTGRSEEFEEPAKRLGAEVFTKPMDAEVLKRIILEFLGS